MLPGGRIVAGLPRQVCIVGSQALIQTGNASNPPTTTSLIKTVVNRALAEAKMEARDVDGLIAVPSLTDKHFMEAHYQASNLGLFLDDRPIQLRTIDTGGAGPVTALLEAVRMIKYEALEVVAIVAGDCVGSMDGNEFLGKADDIFFKMQPLRQKIVRSPAIPHGYDMVTKYQMDQWGLTRDQLRMAVSLQSLHAGLRADSLFYQKAKTKSDQGCVLYTHLDEVRRAPEVTPNISLLECARRADGAACFILASNRFLKRKRLYRSGIPVVIGGGEASGPLYPPDDIDETMFSCEAAMSYAYAQAGNLSSKDIDFFGLYDCFPICLVRALEAAGLCDKGQGGVYLESQYNRLKEALPCVRTVKALLRDPTFFPVNTHGGLLCFGAPWEVPAMYNIYEAVHQLRGNAQGRQIDNCRRALVYGNGGVFSASAVAIMSKSL
mmetsp:Transcript_14933/g.43500  ORF Transcript_14933/g.43500 Transcript_14933/m.43500 type:complete len:437 (-) Transcript_14933:190-1500(-)